MPYAGVFTENYAEPRSSGEIGRLPRSVSLILTAPVGDASILLFAKKACGQRRVGGGGGGEREVRERHSSATMLIHHVWTDSFSGLRPPVFKYRSRENRVSLRRYTVCHVIEGRLTSHCFSTTVSGILPLLSLWSRVIVICDLSLW